MLQLAVKGWLWWNNIIHTFVCSCCLTPLLGGSLIPPSHAGNGGRNPSSRMATTHSILLYFRTQKKCRNFAPKGTTSRANLPCTASLHTPYTDSYTKSWACYCWPDAHLHYVVPHQHHVWHCLVSPRRGLKDCWISYHPIPPFHTPLHFNTW